MGAVAAEIEAIFAGFRRRERVPGVAWGIVAGNELVGQGAQGVAEVGSGRAVTPSTVFRIASMTKSITAGCILALRDTGLLRLDDAVEAYLPELVWSNLSPERLPVTLRDLLTMSSGLVEDDAWADRKLDMSRERFRAVLAEGVVLDNQPGVAFQYSNLGFALLGAVAERVAGQPFAELATEMLLGPLGMTDTTFAVGDAPGDDTARGYGLIAEAWHEEPLLGDGAFGAMGGLATNVADFGRYVAWQLSAWRSSSAEPASSGEPELTPLSRAGRREMQQVWRSGRTFLAGRPEVAADGYGYGLMVGHHARVGRLVAHPGGLPGFGAYVCWFPDSAVGLFGFANLTYAPVYLVVEESIDVLVSAGALQRKEAVLAPRMAEARDAALALYDRWDDQLCRRIAADNLFMDEALDVRRSSVSELRRRVGPCMSIEEVVPSGALRGRWLLHCRGGALDLEIVLTPTRDARVQTFKIGELDRPEQPSGRDGGAPLSSHSRVTSTSVV
ncbi:MAG: serine hydrolase domain-containing protein [Acidimicrobiales bacterium]